MLNSGSADLAVCDALLAPVLDPDLRLFDELADIDDRPAPAGRRSTAGRASRSSRRTAHRRRSTARTPRPHEPCSTPPMKPRERIGQVSIASAAPTGHSAPMPMPSSARKRNRKAKLGEKPAMKLQTEIPGDRDHQRRLAADPIGEPARAVAPTSRIHKRQREDDRVTSVSGTSNSFAIGTMMQQEDGEIEGVERPAEPGRDPGMPLVLGWFLPPRDGLTVSTAVDMTQTSLFVAIQQRYGGTARRKPEARSGWFRASTECLAAGPGIARVAPPRLQ